MKQSLNGAWKFSVDPHRVGETRPGKDGVPVDALHGAALPGYDDGRWVSMPVPSHWQSFGIQYNGAAWYRRTFQFDRAEDRRVFLCITAADYLCDAWLNGYYLGSHEGYFAPFRFEITDWIRHGENSLAILVDAPEDRRDANPFFTGKQQIKGAIADWDANDATLNPGGLWGDVFIEELPPAHIASFSASAAFEDGYARATLALSVCLDNGLARAERGRLSVAVTPKNFAGQGYAFESDVTLTAGGQTCTITFDVDSPALWYSVGLGDPCLYDISLTLSVAGHEHTQSSPFGFREIRQGDGWAMYLNGQRLYLRGANYLSDQLLSTMSQERYEQDIALALEANMNTLRPFCVVEREDFYRLCDEKGLMVYQDYPIQWSMSNASELVRRAILQVRDMIGLLRNHPSVIIWCFGSEPNQDNFEKLGFALASEARRLDPTRIVNQANSCFNLMDYDEMKAKYRWRVDNHFYSGWAYQAFGDMYTVRDLPIDRLDLVSEFGAQALPGLPMMREILRGERIWPPVPDVYTKHCCQYERLVYWIGECKSLEELIERSQRHQAKVLRFVIEYLRRRRFLTPETADACNNGVLLFLFNDCRPMITWSILDYRRGKKAAFDVVKAAFAPLFVGMDWPMRDDAHREEQVCLFAINETGKTFADVELAVEYADAEGNVVDAVRTRADDGLGVNSMLVTPPVPVAKEQQAVYARVALLSAGRVVAENVYPLMPDA